MHRYGLVYPGVGWVLWRDEEYLPEEVRLTKHWGLFLLEPDNVAAAAAAAAVVVFGS
jgi:hypothetical protein